MLSFALHNVITIKQEKLPAASDRWSASSKMNCYANTWPNILFPGSSICPVRSVNFKSTNKNSCRLHQNVRCEKHADHLSINSLLA